MPRTACAETSTALFALLEIHRVFFLFYCLMGEGLRLVQCKGEALSIEKGKPERMGSISHCYLGDI